MLKTIRAASTEEGYENEQQDDTTMRENRSEDSPQPSRRHLSIIRPTILRSITFVWT